MILLGDCLERLKELEENSIDSVVTDPPYGLKFMGKKWDYDVPTIELWREVLRVIKPGGHLLSFGGTRTYHRMVLAIEDAGFEIRDQIQWLYGSGFPKSHDISKGIDKAAGAEREVLGVSPNDRPLSQVKGGKSFDRSLDEGQEHEPLMLTGPATPEAKQWQGWGTALKPANEPIVLARKPLEKGLTVAQNVLKWGVGGLNIDASRVEAADQDKFAKNWDRETICDMRGGNLMSSKAGALPMTQSAPQGRWPANLILDETAAEMLDAQSGHLHGAGNKSTRSEHVDSESIFGMGGGAPTKLYDRGGGASRFFYCAKSSKSERNAGLEGMPEKVSSKMGAGIQSNVGNGVPGETSSEDRRAQNFHPTVKPIKLMEYLIKLITPPNGIVLDPFCGSGSTGVAAFRLGFKFIGIEMNEEYVEIAKKRLEHAKEPA